MGKTANDRYISNQINLEYLFDLIQLELEAHAKKVEAVTIGSPAHWSLVEDLDKAVADAKRILKTLTMSKLRVNEAQAEKMVEEHLEEMRNGPMV